jgi:uncharacterized Zn finger protein
MLDAAIAAVDSQGSYDAITIKRVMDASMEKRADWVIKNASRRAESIINEGKAKHYTQAIEWLKKACQAYHRSGRQKEWANYQATLAARHAKKYKLKEMLLDIEIKQR